jgi:hypothetical protein
VLAFAAQAPPQGGGTLIVQGAHALVEQLVASGRARDGHSRQVRAVLARASDWFKTLMSNTPAPDRINRFMIEGATVDGVRLRVIELTGQPGDVVLMHPWALHAAVPNCAHYPRMMLGQSILRIP